MGINFLYLLVDQHGACFQAHIEVLVFYKILVEREESINEFLSQLCCDGFGENHTSLSSLSEGYRSHLLVLSDILLKLLSTRKNLERKLRKSIPLQNLAQEACGLVLIDEFDRHLHPEWQRNLLSTIRQIFPKLQLAYAFHHKGKEFNQKNFWRDYEEYRKLPSHKRRAGAKNHWRIFKDLFLKIVNNSCPVCGDMIKVFDSDIDHYRPKVLYLWLVYEYRNYLILCKDCNSGYKRDLFPLEEGGQRIDYKTVTNIGATLDSESS